MPYSRAQTRKARICGIVAVIVGLILIPSFGFSLVHAGEGTEFPGTVIKVDQATGKFAVKKDGGGTRFTFTVNEKTKFSGTGLASLKDLKKDDHVMVLYQVKGSQYLAASVTKK
ncbi:MAG TPA: hypothetical protein VNI35_03935 [Nitrospira sp.]|nr:hypothetical protein [Nitrospira sp.]